MLLEQSKINELEGAIDTALAQEIDYKIGTQSKAQQASISINVTKKRKQINPINPFVICFYNSLYEVLRKNPITMKSFQLLLLILHDCALGNLISINQTSLAERMGTNKSNISRYIKELKTAGFFILLKKGLYLNPQIISKGSLLALAENDELTANSISLMQQNDMEVNFGTDAQLANANIEKRKTIS